MKPFLLLLSLAFTLLHSSLAGAHPHVWTTIQTEILYAPDGSIKGVRHAWSFDDMFSAFATQGLDTKKKGEFTRAELKPLAKINVESLKEFGYFTFAKADGKKLEFSPPLSDYYAEYKDSVLTLHLTLPFKKPVKAKELAIEVYDESFFVDFSFADEKPAQLVGAPAGCKVSVQVPEAMDFDTSVRLSQIPADSKVDPSMLLGDQFANRITVKCP
jgi:ABC-type uncharacterized transport system substrate-binding protein